MHDRLASVDDSVVLAALAESWGISGGALDYAPVGFGSYHWVVTDEGGGQSFVTVDDLSAKTWLGDSCDAAFAGLRARFQTAVTLRDRAKLPFVVAPLPTVGGEPVRRLDQRHSIALFPFVDGRSGDFGDDPGPQRRAEVVRLLVELHRATPAVPAAAPLGLQFAGRAGLEAARRDIDSTWRGGPYAEPVRAWLAANADCLDGLLSRFDRLVAEVAAAGPAPVITHGEPHPGNVVRARDGLLLVDWDTVGLAPAERDLWLVATPSGAEAALYAEQTGHEVSRAAMSLYGLAWDLADIAAYVEEFRSPHEQTRDTEQAWLSLTSAALLEESPRGQ